MSKTICKWLEDDEQMLVSPNGQILPCCYLSGYFRIDVTKPITQDKWDEVKDQLYYRSLVDKHVRNHYLYKEYDKRKDELNIFKNDLEEDYPEFTLDGDLRRFGIDDEHPSKRFHILISEVILDKLEK